MNTSLNERNKVKIILPLFWKVPEFIKVNVNVNIKGKCPL